MKLIKIDDLSDSKEILNYRTDKLGKYIIALLLSTLIFILIILWTVDKEIGVKVSGIIRTTENSYDVWSEYQGKISKVNFSDGDLVKLGDILIELDSSLLIDKKDNIEERYQKIKNEYDNYVILAKSINEGVNYFDKYNEQEEKYYYEYIYQTEEEKAHLDDDKRTVEKIDQLKKSIQNVDLCLKSIDESTNKLEVGTAKYYEIDNYLIDINLLIKEIESIQNAKLDQESNDLQIKLTEKEKSLEKLKNDIKYKYINEEEQLKEELTSISYDENHSHTNSYAKMGIMEKISSIKNNMIEIEQQIIQINDEINKTKIISEIDGVIKYDGLYNVGQMVQIGQKLLTISGEESKYTGYFFLPNNEMANISVGTNMKVKVNALNEKDYGYIETRVNEISTKAVRLREESDESVYTIKADLKSEYLEDKKGNKNYLKDDMELEGVIINKKISYLRYIIEYILNI